MHALESWGRKHCSSIAQGSSFEDHTLINAVCRVPHAAGVVKQLPKQRQGCGGRALHGAREASSVQRALCSYQCWRQDSHLHELQRPADLIRLLCCSVG